MDMKIETIKFKVETTEVINSTDNAVLLIGQSVLLMDRSIKLYTDAGYTISDVDSEKFTFTATKIIP